MMKVVVTNEAIRIAKLQSNCHHQQTNNQLFTGRMPFLLPNQQCQSTEKRDELSKPSEKQTWSFLYDTLYTKKQWQK